jgi:hypothetical protein
MLRSFCAIANARICVRSYPEQNAFSQQLSALKDGDTLRSLFDSKSIFRSDTFNDDSDFASSGESTTLSEKAGIPGDEIARDKRQIKGRELEELQLVADPLIRDLRGRYESWLAAPRFYRQKSLKIRGVIYTDSLSHSMGDSIVFYQPFNTSLFVPRRIRYILWVPVPVGKQLYHKEYFLACQRFLEAPAAEILKPSLLFSAFPEFKLSMWANSFKEEIEVFPANGRLCHANMVTWSSKIVVLKQLDRVSISGMTYLSTSDSFPDFIICL